MTAATNFKITDPTGARQLGALPLTAPDDVAAVVTSAARGQAAWAARPVVERADILMAAADALEPEATALGDLLAAESGKPLGQARFEVACAIELLRGNAYEGRRLVGRVLPAEGTHGTTQDLAFTRREPLGVVAAILPFNFPVELFVEKCAAALVAGNAVVVKPPLEDPLVVTRFRAALLAAGVPESVLGMVYGDRDVGAALAEHPLVDAISLTGSTTAGLAVARSNLPRLRPLHLELGGNNASIVLADADLELVVRELTFGRLMMNGQACSASKRIIVAPSLHDELVDRLAAACAAQIVGDATDPRTTIGPLITPAAAMRVAGQVERALREGAMQAHGAPHADGPFMAPCVLARVPPRAAVATDDEIFGPVFTVMTAESPEQAVALANASIFGLMASVFSSDLARALSIAEQLQAGGVVINGTDNYRPPFIPFHGVKLSGTGREGLGFTLEEMTREKTIIFRRFRQPMTIEGTF